MSTSMRLLVATLASACLASCDTLFGPLAADEVKNKHVAWEVDKTKKDLYDYALSIHAVERNGREVKASGDVSGTAQRHNAVRLTVVEERALLRRTFLDVLRGVDTIERPHEIGREYSEDEARKLKGKDGKEPPKPGLDKVAVPPADLPEKTVTWQLEAEDDTMRGSTQPSLGHAGATGTWHVRFNRDVIEWAAAKRQVSLTLRVTLGENHATRQVTRQTFVDATSDE